MVANKKGNKGILFFNYKYEKKKKEERIKYSKKRF